MSATLSTPPGCGTQSAFYHSLRPAVASATFGKSVDPQGQGKAGSANSSLHFAYAHAATPLCVQGGWQRAIYVTVTNCLSLSAMPLRHPVLLFPPTCCSERALSTPFSTRAVADTSATSAHPQRQQPTSPYYPPHNIGSSSTATALLTPPGECRAVSSYNSLRSPFLGPLWGQSECPTGQCQARSAKCALTAAMLMQTPPCARLSATQRSVLLHLACRRRRLWRHLA